MTDHSSLPVAVIGAGPVGLAAAAHLAERHLPFVVLEAGDSVGAAIHEWAHVTVFSPWRYNVDKAAARMLDAAGWSPPDGDSLPTGREIIDRYLTPLAAHPAIAPHLRFNTRVEAVGRKGFDKVRTAGRDEQPFELHVADGTHIEARAVIDASGTWRSPNPMGSGGIPVPGEREHRDRIRYGIPDVLGRDRNRFAGKRVMVVGSGHSAMNAVLDLLRLVDDAPDTSITWVMRRADPAAVFGGGADDALPARGALGQRARDAVDRNELMVLSPFRIQRVAPEATGLRVSGDLDGVMHDTSTDEIIVATGFRSDLSVLGELRIAVDPWLESAAALGPLIDPNVHSCGTVRPHGWVELAHPEKDLFIVGMKSYGRAPTFLMATGYEQVRSVVAHLAGDVEAAARVELELPETGVCSTAGAESQLDSGDGGGCCGGPAPAGVDACCVKDADAKAAGEVGCGCGSEPVHPPEPDTAADGSVYPVGVGTPSSDGGGGCC